MTAIGSLFLASIGLGLIAVEIFLFSFFLMFIGVSFILVSIYHSFLPFETLWVQLISVSVISIVLVFLFRTKLKSVFKKAEKELNPNFLKKGGMGVIKNKMVLFKGVYFEINSNKEYKEGEEVEVLRTEKNVAYLK